MSSNKEYPELNAEKIDAIREEMRKDSANIDRFFLLKLHTTILLCLFSASMMIFFPRHITYWLLVNTVTYPEQLDSTLITRGVFVLGYMLVAIFSWRKDRYTELIFGSATIMAFTNFLLDIPYLVSAEYSGTPITIAIGILVRLIIIGLLVSIFRNLERANYLQGKLFANPFAPLKL